MRKLSEIPQENFGLEAKDKVTGFKGIITAVTLFMYGCAQYCITPPIAADGKKGDNEWFDDGRIEITGNGIAVESVKGTDRGCETRDHGDRR
jgi:hypothetical protein